MPVTSMRLSTAPTRKKPKAGDTKMIRGVLHVRKQARMVDGPYRGAYLVNNGRPVWEWVAASVAAHGEGE